jgi:hypothetical protein
MVEGYCSSARERIYQYVAVTRNSSSGNQMVREPAAPTGPQIVITDASAAGRGVDEPAVTCIKGDVTNAPTLLEEHQITDLHRAC